MLEADYVPGNNEQCAYRVVNVNKLVATLCRFASLPNSIDDRIQRINVRKVRDLKRLFS